MKKEIQLRVSPDQATSHESVMQEAAKALSISIDEISDVRIRKRSLDARSKKIKYQLLVEVWINEPATPYEEPEFKPKKIIANAPVVVIGSGPGGLFAALQLLELGIRPIVIERGKDVKMRRHDLAALNKEHIVNPNSNYCFGEGGAGTYSDGKLTMRSKKRGNAQSVLELFVAMGADMDILVDARPHIGTNKLPKIITTIRNAIIGAGGEFHLETILLKLQIKNSQISGVITDKGTFPCSNVILATGHSANDIYMMLQRQDILIEAKPTAIGVRIEHPQSLIDKIQYHCSTRPDTLPPAAYNFVQPTSNGSIYSFCMCPGGVIAPCATAPGEVVTNGWSSSKRNNSVANSGVVVGININQYEPYLKQDGLCGLAYRQSIEKKCCELAGKTQKVPAQRLVDFLERKTSSTLPKTSYIPGIVSIPMDKVLPAFIVNSLREGLSLMDKKMRSYITNDAILHAPESRTSSPVRIPRNPETLEHVRVKGLYPCGEGAGYAGGIVSAAIDGQNCAKSIATQLK